MSLPAELMALGLPHGLSNRIGAEIATGVVAAGNSQTTATALSAAFNEIGTATSGTGVMLNGFSDNHVLFNGGANPALAYPPVGGYMNGTQNAGFSVTNGKSATFFRSGLRYIATLSA